MKKEIPLTLIRACQQIVNGLVDSIMALEKSNTPRLVGCVTALHSFAQIRPQLLVEHAISLEPWLNIKCNSPDRVKFISMLAEILEHVRIRFFNFISIILNYYFLLGRATNGTSRRNILIRS